MSNENLILSEVVKEFDGQLVSDGEFNEINYCTKDVGKPFLCFIENPKFVSKIDRNVSCALCTKELASCLPDFVKGVFICDEPKVTFHKILNKYAETYKSTEETKIGKNCNISGMASIATRGVVIGDNVTIEPFVVITENVKIGNNVTIRSNTTIGGKSFSLVRTNDNDVIGLKDIGTVIIDDNVEILGGVQVEKGILKSDCTFIGKNTKIDVLSHIGHGTVIGERVLVAAGTVIGGNATIGNDVWIGLNATIANRIVVGNNVRINLGAVVTQNIKDDEHVSGNFAIKHESFISYIKDIKRKYVK